MTTTIAGLPHHDRVTDPVWLKLFHDYRHVVTPLRHTGWITDIEPQGIRADLADGTELFITPGQATLPDDPTEVTGWNVVRQGIGNPSQHTALYDSTPNGPQRHHGRNLLPMFLRLDELTVPKTTERLSVRSIYSTAYGMNHHQPGGVESPGMAVARYFEWSHHMAVDEGFRCVWERSLREGYPMAVFERGGHVSIVRVTRGDD